jgi:predicted enzyme related to lactoylglutathione lyase
MPEVLSHPPGAFCFAELAAADLGAASDFYCGLFDWESVGVPPVPEAGYFLFRLEECDVAGMYQLPAKQRENGDAPTWLPYISVSSADDSAEKLTSLGGTLLAPPFDVGEIGRMCHATDPGGARFALWQPTGHVGYRKVGEPGSVCWMELAASGVASAIEFYTGLFGWEAVTKPMGGYSYTEWKLGKKVIGGMLEMTPEWKGIPPRWMTYFAVEDCDLSARLAMDLGGRVEVAPDDIPGLGRFAVIADPGGAEFSIFTARLTA